MKEVESTVSQLQQLVIDEQKRRMSMENQLSAAQDKIGAAERKSTMLESKNKQLETKVASWTTAYNEQMMSQSNPIASGSGVSNTVQMISQALRTVPISSMMTMPLSPPQGPLPNIGEVQTENRFPLGPQGNRRVSFGSVFDASLGQNGGQNNDETLNDWGEPLEGGDGHRG